MNFVPLPRRSAKAIIPPIKCQGIKTKLVEFILANIRWEGAGRWIEPFLGSGVVLFSVQPERALVNDINPHIINLYRKVYEGSLSSSMVREHLTEEGKRLLREENYYYTVRERFNQTGEALDFLFLNRSCFNGLMRFNKKGEFNVPFCRKPDRFRPAYITKIVNQVKNLKQIMGGKDWEFRAGDWRECFNGTDKDDFVYLDPPYIGRHTDYYEQWSDADAIELASKAQSLPCGFALSMWKENKYRLNDHIPDYWTNTVERTMTHFYHVGSTESLRNSMEEALLIKPGYEALRSAKKTEVPRPVQIGLSI
ncbi:MAG: Dam family site-specific DNA-(adenine-N6)-methyltransferase [Chloroflexi bacterium]|nr:Dam family site-specific DNA-(adenine-N6)-methyltransferase [Chloroflexota bacterium]